MSKGAAEPHVPGNVEHPDRFCRGFESGYEWRHWHIDVVMRRLKGATSQIGVLESLVDGSDFYKGWFAGITMALDELLKELEEERKLFVKELEDD